MTTPAEDTEAPPRRQLESEEVLMKRLLSHVMHGKADAETRIKAHVPKPDPEQEEGKPPKKRRPMSPAQQLRRDRNRGRHGQRQARYPLDPDDPKGRTRIERVSPQALQPPVPKDKGTSMRCCVEKVSKPNEFLYLYLVQSYETGRTYRWVTTLGQFQPRKHTSLYEALQDVIEQGYEDASW